jgi:hypothetical protein
MMLKKSPRAAVQNSVRWLRSKSRPASARIRLRRRLYLFSAPVVAMLVLAAAKAILVGIVGNSAIPDFTRHDIEALRDDVSLLSIFDVIDPAKTSFVAGDLSVLEGRLQDADARFSDSFSRTDERQSCPVRVNLLLIRETLGDLATRAGDKQQAEHLYTAGLTLANDAPPACFAGNADPNPDRRAIREHSVLRLHQKLEILRRPPAAAPPPASIVVPPPPPPPPTSLTQLTSAPPLPGLPESSAPSSTAPGQGAAPAPEPGPNMPGPPETGTASGPILGPDGDSDEGPEGPGPLNPVSPDRLPTGGDGAAPGHRLGSGVPLDRLRKLLDNSNAYGDNQE